MSLTRGLSAWILRALLLWGALEGGTSIYEESANKTQMLAAVSGQHEVMQRLEQRALAAETRAASLDVHLTAAAHPSWPSIPDQNGERDAADALRQQLIELGAQAPIVDATSATAGGRMRHLSFQARWREAAETSPSVLHLLAARFPDFTVARLHMTRGDGLISTEAQFEALAPVANTQVQR